MNYNKATRVFKAHTKKIVGILVILLGLISVLGYGQYAQAAGTPTWKTANHIKVDNKMYTFAGMYSNKQGSYKPDGGGKYRAYKTEGDDCQNFYLINTQNPVEMLYLMEQKKVQTSTQNGCSDPIIKDDKAVVTNDSRNKFIVHYWEDINTIKRLDRGFDNADGLGAITFKREAKTDRFVEQTGDSCKDFFTLKGNQQMSYTAQSTGFGKSFVGYNADEGHRINVENGSVVGVCNKSSEVGMLLGFEEYASIPEGKNTNAPKAGDTGKTAGDDTDQSIDECSKALAPFGWVLCPILTIADGFYQWFAQTVSGLLFLESSKYNTPEMKQSWGIFVRIANTLIVLFGLTIIAGQIFKFEVFSAYTVKKALPRLVIGAVLIQLSWFLSVTLVELVNAVGSGIYWLIVAPFNMTAPGGKGIQFISFFNAVGSPGALEDSAGDAFSNFLGFGLAVGAAAVVLHGAWFAIIMAMVGVIISILVAIVTLIFREMLIIVLLVLAPVAIAFWILPGTNNIWKMWWQSFSKALLMYPLIMILLAGGAVGAHIMHTSANDQHGIANFAAVIAFFVPLFLISATFKFAGAAFGSINKLTGKVGQWGNKKINDGNMLGLKKFNENQKTSRKENKKIGGFQDATTVGNTTMARYKRAKGRIALGTAGTSGAHARQVRASERESAIKNANSQMLEDIKSKGITDYDDQLAYKQALAKGMSSVIVGNGDTVEVQGYGSGGQAAATQAIIESGKADRIRDVQQTLDASDAGKQIWSNTMETHAAKATAVAADSTGKAFSDLRPSEMATQDPTTLRNMAQKYLSADTDANEKAKLQRIAMSVKDSETLYGGVNEAGRVFLDYVASGGSLAVPNDVAKLDNLGNRIS